MKKCRLDILTQQNTVTTEEPTSDWLAKELYAQTMQMRGYVIELNAIDPGVMGGVDATIFTLRTKGPVPPTPRYCRYDMLDNFKKEED
jgi:hypothetical protein